MGVLVGRSAPDFTAAAVLAAAKLLRILIWQKASKAKKQLSSFTLWISPLSAHLS